MLTLSFLSNRVSEDYKNFENYLQGFEGFEGS